MKDKETVQHCCNDYAYVWRIDRERVPLMGYTECLTCGTTFDDERGLPRSTFNINGLPVSFQLLQMKYICPVCSAKILVRFRGGKYVATCAGTVEHNIGAMRHALLESSARYQEVDEILEGSKALANMPLQYRDLMGDADAS